MHSGGSGGGGGSDSSGALWAACDQSRHVNQILRVSYEASAMHTNTEPESSWVESNLACHLFPPHLSGWAPVCCHAFFIYSVHKNRFSPFFGPFASTLTDKNFFFFSPNYSMQLHCWDSKSRGLFCIVWCTKQHPFEWLLKLLLKTSEEATGTGSALLLLKQMTVEAAEAVDKTVWVWKRCFENNRLKIFLITFYRRWLVYNLYEVLT